jgi:hypothetical protein
MRSNLGTEQGSEDKLSSFSEGVMGAMGDLVGEQKDEAEAKAEAEAEEKARREAEARRWLDEQRQQVAAMDDDEDDWSESDDDSDGSFNYEDDLDQMGGGNISANLMASLGLGPKEAKGESKDDYDAAPKLVNPHEKNGKSDWVAPAKSGLDNSKPLFDMKG